jgi:hypothetical protein
VVGKKESTGKKYFKTSVTLTINGYYRGNCLYNHKRDKGLPHYGEGFFLEGVWLMQ